MNNAPMNSAATRVQNCRDLKVRAAGLAVLLGLVLGVSLDAQARPTSGSPGHAGVVVQAAGHPHHRGGPPAHRFAPQHHSHGAIPRGSRSLSVSPQSRLADWYARTAVRQSHTAWRFGCANSHPRWSTSYHDHYRWAYSQSANRAQREIERRERTIAQCLAR